MSDYLTLDVEYIQEKLDKGYQYTEEAKGRDVVLVIGNTGVGKSTSCNYLQGNQMKEEEYNGRSVIETVQETPIKIGHRIKAETLYAQTIVIETISSLRTKTCNEHICLVDCPGFYGNRTTEEKVVETVSIELAIRAAQQVKGVLILISFNSLMAARLSELRDLMRTLISLFKDPVEMVKYSLFLITNKHKLIPDDEAKRTTIGALRSLKDHCKEQANFYRQNTNLSSSESLTAADYDKIETYFSAVLKNSNNIIFINPLDKGESRKLIIDRINGVKPRMGFFKEFGASVVKKVAGTAGEEQIYPITINDFIFSEGNEGRSMFNKALYERALEGQILISKVQRCVDTNRSLLSEISSGHRRLPMLEQLQSNIQEEIYKTDEGKSDFSKIDFESIRMFELITDENDKQIKFKKREIGKIDAKITEVNEELKSIDTDEPILFIEKFIYRDVSYWKVFGWEEMTFKACTRDNCTSIIDVKKEMQNGKWVDEDDRRDEGVYGITYQSQYSARPAYASVKTYIKCKHEAGNKVSIKRLTEEQLSLTETQTKLKSEIADLESKNQILQSNVARANFDRESYKKDLTRRLEDCKKDQECLKTKIPKMEDERKQVKLTGMESLQEFECNRRKFDVIKSIANLLEFPSNIIKNFISQYNEFLSCIDIYKSSLSEQSDDSLPYARENNNSEGGNIFILKDPITGDAIKHLVLSPAGTAFDEHSLLKQFDHDKLSPFIFSKEDGSTEEIRYLSWQKIPDVQKYIDRFRNQSNYHQETVFSQKSPPTFMRSEVNEMNPEQLEGQKSKLIKEIQALREELEVKETDLGRICRRLQNLLSEKQ